MRKYFPQAELADLDALQMALSCPRDQHVLPIATRPLRSSLHFLLVQRAPWVSSRGWEDVGIATFWLSGVTVLSPPMPSSL